MSLATNLTLVILRHEEFLKGNALLFSRLFLHFSNLPELVNFVVLVRTTTASVVPFLASAFYIL